MSFQRALSFKYFERRVVRPLPLFRPVKVGSCALQFEQTSRRLDTELYYVKVGKEFGISDNAVKKIMRKL